MSATLKARLRAGESLVGGLVRMPCEEVVEMLAVAGMDFVILDCEHGPGDVMALRTHIALAQVHGLAVLVRPGYQEWPLVLRALDQGAEGVVAPHIDSAEDAAALVGAAHYPPTGERGFATYPRAGRFGTVSPAEHLTAASEGTVVLAMLESVRAVADAERILSIPGIDGYLIGVADLGASAGADQVAKLVGAVHERGAAALSWRADLAGSPADAQAAFSAGARLVVYNVAQVLMRTFSELASVPHSR